MDKKQYIAPCVEICNVELENAILAASGVQGDAESIGFDEGPVAPESALSRKHYGIWDD